MEAAARELGIHRHNAHRAVQVASLSDDAKEITREVGLDDNRSMLLAASREETPEEGGGQKAAAMTLIAAADQDDGSGS